jgi:hypothetical protein
MAGLTESFLINDFMKNVENRNWYDRVYLCIEKSSHDHKVNNGFTCYTFKDFKDATAYQKHLRLENTRNTTIPMCKWVPTIFHKDILNKKLIETFWCPKITLLRPRTVVGVYGNDYSREK